MPEPLPAHSLPAISHRSSIPRPPCSLDVNTTWRSKTRIQIWSLKGTQTNIAPASILTCHACDEMGSFESAGDAHEAESWVPGTSAKSDQRGSAERRIDYNESYLGRTAKSGVATLFSDIRLREEPIRVDPTYLG